MKHQLINHHLLLALSVLLLPSVLMYSANALPQEQSVTQAVYKEIAEREYDFIIVGAELVAAFSRNGSLDVKNFLFF